MKEPGSDASELTALEESLCQAYLLTDNKSEALRKSDYKTDGWRPETVNTKAVQLFAKAKIKARVDYLLKQREQRTGINADYVLKRHHEIDQMDVLDIFNEDLTALHPLSEWPKVWRTTISGLDVSELFEYTQGEKELSGFLKKVKWPDKVKNLELLGRHVSVQAYKDKVELDATDKLAETLAKARNRAKK